MPRPRLGWDVRHGARIPAARLVLNRLAVCSSAQAGAVASLHVTSLEITPTGLGELEPGSAAEGARADTTAHEPLLRGQRARLHDHDPNEILLSLGALKIMFGSWRDALLLGILVSNIAVGGFGRDRRSVTDVLVEGCW